MAETNRVPKGTAVPGDNFPIFAPTIDDPPLITGARSIENAVKGTLHPDTVTSLSALADNPFKNLAGLCTLASMDLFWPAKRTTLATTAQQFRGFPVVTVSTTAEYEKFTGTGPYRVETRIKFTINNRVGYDVNLLYDLAIANAVIPSTGDVTLVMNTTPTTYSPTGGDGANGRLEVTIPSGQVESELVLSIPQTDLVGSVDLVLTQLGVDVYQGSGASPITLELNTPIIFPNSFTFRTIDPQLTDLTQAWGYIVANFENLRLSLHSGGVAEFEHWGNLINSHLFLWSGIESTAYQAFMAQSSAPMLRYTNSAPTNPPLVYSAVAGGSRHHEWHPNLSDQLIFFIGPDYSTTQADYNGALLAFFYIEIDPVNQTSKILGQVYGNLPSS